MPRPSNPPKPHPFTEEQIRARAKALWEQRGDDSTDTENWADAIRELQREQAIKRVTKPLRRVWWKTGLGAPLRQWWEWTGVKEKKGWDVVQLLVGISIPIVLFVGGQYFTSQNNEKQQQLADDKAKQDTLVKYLDQMADSIKDDLLTAKPGDKRFIVAQTRTVIALQSLDRLRQHLVIQFLSDSGLNDPPARSWQPFGKQDQPNPLPAQSRVLLYKAQLSKAHLIDGDLNGAVLIGANLENASLGCKPSDSKAPAQCSDLAGADLRGADLSGADLSGADLGDANLQSADLQSADLSSTILLATNFRQARNLTQRQLEGEDLPFLCNVTLPKGFTVNPNRDCDRLPPVLLERYPASYKTLKDAENGVNQWRQ